MMVELIRFWCLVIKILVLFEIWCGISVELGCGEKGFVLVIEIYGVESDFVICWYWIGLVNCWIVCVCFIEIDMKLVLWG